MSSRILSISYDSSLLHTRRLVLSHGGYDVESAGDLASAVELCRADKFDVVVIGHGVPLLEAATIVEVMRGRALIVSLFAGPGPRVEHADLYVDAADGPEQLLSVLQAALEHNSRFGVQRAG
jgi:DNA-binding NtrC family response regulator